MKHERAIDYIPKKNLQELNQDVCSKLEKRRLDDEKSMNEETKIG